MSRTGKHNSCPPHFVKVLEARCFILEGYNLVCKEIEEVTYHNGGNLPWLGKEEVPPSPNPPSVSKQADIYSGLPLSLPRSILRRVCHLQHTVSWESSLWLHRDTA